ncbi:MAG: hypothetical protein U1E05_25910 [Patescibacteria group bacterium]|nr:hypothetical protein [Patescibacteria group bacterium]
MLLLVLSLPSLLGANWPTARRRSTKSAGRGCFINIISAGGLVLIPEASLGCSCAYPVQMSIAYAP